MSLEALQALDGPAWPDAGLRPVVFLIDASSMLERRIVLDWIRRTRPDGASYRIADLPASRRRRFIRRGVPAGLKRVVEGEEDALLVPVRVAWLAPERNGRRTVSLVDLLLFGDPRDPGRLRQEWVLRRHPDRMAVISGEPASVSELRSSWVEARAKSPDDPSGFAEFVALRAQLAMERTERKIRGNRYKVPRFVAEDLLSRRSFRMGLVRLADQSGKTADEAVREAGRYLREIAATHSTFVIDLVAALIRTLYTMGYARKIHYDRAELQRLYQLGQEHPLVFLPGHKSNLDHLVLMYVLYENGLPPNHTAGGINMNFFPAGPLIRRAGVFFIRRSFKDNEPYKFVLKRYLDYLLSKRFPLQWFIEGGRSRSGKLRPPRFGLLAYVADSFRRGSCDDAVLIPVSIAYDQILDIGSFTVEQKGGPKEREGFSWMVRTIRTLRRRYGRIHVNFGRPISLAAELRPYGPGVEGRPDTEALEIQKLAFEVAVRINRSTPVTPISLVTLALLGARDRALTVLETLAAVEPYLRRVEGRSLPAVADLGLDTPESVEAALEALREHGVVSRFAGGPETVYSIEPEQHLAAAYYRNTIIHFFTTAAITEMSLLAAAEAEGDPLEVFWDSVRALRDLLKFEFFFADREEFRAEVADGLASYAPDWETAFAAGREAVLDLARAFHPFSAPWALRPFLEAYRVVADGLEFQDYRLEVEEKTLMEACMALGKQYRLQHRIQSPESVSTVLMGNGLRLAANRGLMEGGGPDQLERRRRFAVELREVLRRIDGLEALAAARRAGLED
jgi:glycerol-3-phosphate O-acyltransferase